MKITRGRRTITLILLAWTIFLIFVAVCEKDWILAIGSAVLFVAVLLAETLP